MDLPDADPALGQPGSEGQAADDSDVVEDSGDLGLGRPIPASAPQVVAVVVTHNAGPWFEEALQSLVDQDYPNLLVLVIDAASTEDPTPRIASVAPRAFVRRLGANPGFGAAVNVAMGMVEGAAFYLICHDDVALAPGATRLLVEEAYRSNAGLVGPKLVRWDQPQALLAVGMGVDRFAVPAPLCERGELDQEQHDAVRDVFSVPGAAFLVRADLFRAVGGFDEAITFHGEDTDLAWRAHLAGARVLVAPSAVGRHVEALGDRRPDDRRRLQARHRLRMVATNYGWFFLLGEGLQQVVLSLLEIILSVVTGRFGQAADVVRAYVWNAKRLGSIVAKRRANAKRRQLTDLEIRRLQVRGSARVTAFLRGQLGPVGRALGGDAAQHGGVAGDVAGAAQRVHGGASGPDGLSGSGASSAGASTEDAASLADVGRQWLDAVRVGVSRDNVFAGLAVTMLVAVGSRGLIAGRIPAVGEFVAFPDRARDLLAGFWSGWRSAGLGATGFAPTGEGLFGLAGLVLLGATGLLRRLLVLGTIPVGLLGAWRLADFAAHTRAKAAALLAYAVNPVAYNALSVGSWRGLVLYGAAPWFVRRLAVLGGLGPFAAPAGAARRLVAGAGLMLAIVVVWFPGGLFSFGLMALALVLGSLLVGSPAGSLRIVVGAAGAAVLAVVLHGPWLLGAWGSGDPDVTFAGRSGGAEAASLTSLLHFDSGGVNRSFLTWGLLVAGLLGLAIGRSWRLEWAVRGWLLFAVPLGLVAVVQAGWLDVRLPPAEVLLVPGAVGIAMAVAAGMAAFDLDLPVYRFGWRQLASVGAAGGLLVASLAFVAGAADGRWRMPRSGYDRTFGFLANEQQTNIGPFRVLWLGAPGDLPAAGWSLDEDVAYATSIGFPSTDSLWTGPETDATQLVPDALFRARAGDTSRLGRELSVMSIRYVVVVDQLAPVPFRGRGAPAPEWLQEVLSQQLDLAQVDLNAAVTVFRNPAWLPVVALLPPGAETVSDLPPVVDPGATPTPALAARGSLSQRFEGPVSGGSVLHLAQAADPSWRLTIDGSQVTAASSSSGTSSSRTSPPAGGTEGRGSLAWANRFEVSQPGDAVLRSTTSSGHRLLLVVQLLAWLVVSGMALARRQPPAHATGGEDTSPSVPGATKTAPTPDTIDLAGGGDREEVPT